MTPFSCYILTFNSEKYLAAILEPLKAVTDDIVIVDSGSRDQTEAIARKFGVRFLVRTFDDFRQQRNFGIQSCFHNWVFSLDSDEVPDATMIRVLQDLKSNDFRWQGKSAEAFQLKRFWYVLGQPVRAFLPVTSPDFPIRLFQKDKVWFKDESNIVHETPSGFSKMIRIEEGCMHHYSIDSVEQLYGKLNQYTRLAAMDMKRKGKSSTWARVFGRPLTTWFKWYVIKGGWKDGGVGWVLGRYAYDYAYQKYLRRKFDFQ